MNEVIVAVVWTAIIVTIFVVFFTFGGQIECSQCGCFNHYWFLKPRKCEYCNARMSDRREFWVPTDVDIEGIQDRQQQKRVADLIVDQGDGKITLADLLKRYDASQKADKIINDDYWDIPIVIASIFHIPKAEHINESIEKLLDKIDNLEAKLRNHRHDMAKTYSSKAEF